MSSRKEEERNEKIIRGLMKLPPNRRCFNCNSLGPQYVCTNFWTFICMTCSGIHREFTHRVKSVSMAKFTSQEVEALQNGGNQRAREIYLKDWDFTRQRLPDSSNVEKIRDFIKNVYVVRKYAGRKISDKPPRDTQSPRRHEEETRRASSYHSYSQSPPYDYQYEERRYGKQSAALTRKPGSDRGHYESKLSSFISSPGQFCDQAFEERFENDGSGRRISDCTGSIHGEHVKYDMPSPNFHKGCGFISPSSRGSSSEDVWTQARMTSLETNSMRVADGIPRPQRSTSSGSFGSSEGNSFSIKSNKSHISSSVVDVSSEARHGASSLGEIVPTWSPPSGLAQSGSLDFTKESSAPEAVLSAPSIDLFQSPAIPQAPPIDLFQSPAFPQAPSVDSFQPSLFAGGESVVVNHPSQSSQPASVDFFTDISQQHLTAAANKITEETAVPKNEGWATFDALQSIVYTSHVDVTPTLQDCVALSAKFDPFPSINSDTQFSSFDTQATTTTLIERDSRLPTNVEPLPENFHPFSSFHANFEFQSFENSGASGPSIESNPWDDILPVERAPVAQRWNAFENTNDHYSAASDQSERSVQINNLSSSEDQQLSLSFSQEFVKDKFQTVASGGGFPDKSMLSHIIAPLGETCKSHNPFDLPFDSDSEKSNAFLDMSSLQGALPNSMQSAFNGDVAEPWFSQPPYIPSAAPGSLTYIAAQPLTSPFPTVRSQEPVASVGGNPFA